MHVTNLDKIEHLKSILDDMYTTFRAECDRVESEIKNMDVA